MPSTDATKAGEAGTRKIRRKHGETIRSIDLSEGNWTVIVDRKSGEVTFIPQLPAKELTAGKR